MDKKPLIIFSFISAGILIVLAVLNFRLLTKQESTLDTAKNIMERAESKVLDVAVPKSKEILKLAEIAGLTHTVKGIIRKEKIPTELELGDSWYWIYFDEPFLLEQNAAGFPLFVDKMQITESVYGNFKIADYENKHVIINMQIGWGYAESSTVEPIAISTLD